MTQQKPHVKAVTKTVKNLFFVTLFSIFAIIPAIAIAAVATGVVNVTVTDTVARASSTAPVTVVLSITSNRANGLVINNQPTQTPFRVNGSPNQAVAVSLPQNPNITFAGKTIDLSIFANTGTGTPTLNNEGLGEFILETASGPSPTQANTESANTTATAIGQSQSQTVRPDRQNSNVGIADFVPLIVSSPFINITISYN